MYRTNLIIAITNDPNAIVPRWLKTTMPMFVPTEQQGTSFLFFVQYHFAKVPVKIIEILNHIEIHLLFINQW